MGVAARMRAITEAEVVFNAYTNPIWLIQTAIACADDDEQIAPGYSQ